MLVRTAVSGISVLPSGVHLKIRAPAANTSSSSRWYPGQASFRFARPCLRRMYWTLRPSCPLNGSFIHIEENCLRPSISNRIYHLHHHWVNDLHNASSISSNMLTASQKPTRDQ